MLQRLFSISLVLQTVDWSLHRFRVWFFYFFCFDVLRVLLLPTVNLEGDVTRFVPENYEHTPTECSSLLPALWWDWFIPKKKYLIIFSLLKDFSLFLSLPESVCWFCSLSLLSVIKMVQQKKTPFWLGANKLHLDIGSTIKWRRVFQIWYIS